MENNITYIIIIVIIFIISIYLIDKYYRYSEMKMNFKNSIKNNIIYDNKPLNNIINNDNKNNKIINKEEEKSANMNILNMYYNTFDDFNNPFLPNPKGLYIIP